MASQFYNLFCPVSKACELLEPRWTLLILCELWVGSSRFNEIRRGVPGISPSLLSKRLREMEAGKLVVRKKNPKTGILEYFPSQLAMRLQPIVYQLGDWAHKNIDKEITLENLDPRVFMWTLRRKIDTAFFPAKRSVLQFTFPEFRNIEKSYWLIVKPGIPTDVCLSDPGHDVDLFFNSSLYVATSVLMGFTSMHSALSKEDIVLLGEADLIKTIDQWLLKVSYI